MSKRRPVELSPGRSWLILAGLAAVLILALAQLYLAEPIVATGGMALETYGRRRVAAGFGIAIVALVALAFGVVAHRSTKHRRRSVVLGSWVMLIISVTAGLIAML